MIFDRLKSILLFFAALSVGFAAYAQSTDGEKTVFIDFNSPECTFTGVKEGFETDSLYKALGYSTWFNRWSNTPFKYVNAPASEMPYGLSEREGSNALFEAYKPVTNINPIAQMRQGDVIVNFNWKYATNTASYTAKVTENFSCRITDPKNATYCLYDIEADKNVITREPERFIWWVSYREFTISVPEGYKITKVEFAPMITSYNTGIVSSNFDAITFRDSPKTVASSGIMGNEFGSKELFGRQNTWPADKYAAVRWVPGDTTVRSVSVYLSNGLKFLIASRSICVSYAPDTDYTEPTETTAEPVVYYTNGSEMYPNTFFKSADILIAPEDGNPDTEIFYTLDGSDPTDEANLNRVKRTGSVQFTNRTADIAIRVSARDAGKKYSEPRTVVLKRMATESLNSIAVTRRDGFEFPDIPAVFALPLNILDSYKSGDRHILTVCDGSAPFAAMRIESGKPFPENYIPGKALSGIPLLISPGSGGTLTGNADPFIDYIYNESQSTSSGFTLADATGTPDISCAGTTVRYTFAEIENNNIKFADGSLVPIVPTGGRELPEFFEGKKNRITGIAEESAGQIVVSYISSSECPDLPRFTANNREAGDTVVFFTSANCLLLEPKENTTYYIDKPNGDRIIWLPNQPLQVNGYFNLDFIAAIGNIGVVRHVLFRRITPASESPLSNILQGGSLAESIHRVKGSVAVMERYGNFYTVADGDGNVFVIRSTNGWGGDYPEAGTSYNDFAVKKSENDGLIFGDISEYRNTLNPGEEIALPQPVVIAAEDAADLPLNRLVTITGWNSGTQAARSAGFSLYCSLGDNEYPDSRKNYNLTGFLNSPTLFVVLDAEELPECDAPAISISPDNGSHSFLTSTTVHITGAEGAEIRYTGDGSDPLTSPDAYTYSRPIRISSGMTVKAVALMQGHSPSAVATAELRRITTEVPTLADAAQAGNITALVTGSADVIARTKHYLILRDASGYACTVFTGDSRLPATLDNGDCIRNFVFTCSPDGFDASDYTYTYTSVSEGTPSAVADIAKEELSTVKPHSLVRIRGVFTGEDCFEGVPVITDETDLTGGYPVSTEGKTFVITAIYTSLKGLPWCLVPLDIRDVSGTPPEITADCGDNPFPEQTVITITHPAADALIFYRINKSAWMQYGGAITVKETSVIEAYAKEADYELCYSQPLSVRKMERSGNVTVTAEYRADGSALVCLTPDSPGLITYTTDGSDPVSSPSAKEYSAPFELRESATVNAVLTESLKTPGAVATSTITVVLKTLVSRITLGNDDITGYADDTVELAATVEPENATDKTIHWSSSDNRVATVDSNGTIALVAPGTAVITGTAADGSGVSVSCIVTVADPASSIHGTESARLRMDVENSTLIISGLQPGERIGIHTASGTTVATRRATDATMTFTLPGKGVYIVTTPRATRKILIPHL